MPLPLPEHPKSCSTRANTSRAVGRQHLGSPAAALSSPVQSSSQKHPWQRWAPATRSGAASPASCWDTTMVESLEQVTRFTLRCQTLADPFEDVPFHVPPSPFLARRPTGRRCPPSPGLSLLVPWHMEAATSQGAAARARGFPSDTPAFSPARAAVAGGFLQRGECFLSAARGQRRAALLAEVNH